MFPNQFTPQVQLPKVDQEKARQKPAININTGIENISFDKMPTLGANLDLSRSFEFCAMNTKNLLQNSFYNNWEPDFDDVEERKILEDLKGGSKVGVFGDTKEEGSLFQRDRLNPTYSVAEKGSTGQNEYFPTETNRQAQEIENVRGMPRALAVQEVETHGMFNAGRKREASQNRNLNVVTRPAQVDSPLLTHLDRMVPVRQQSLGETVNSEFIQMPIPDKDSGSKTSKSDFGKDDKNCVECEPKGKCEEHKEVEVKQQEAVVNKRVVVPEPIIEASESRSKRANSEERCVEIIENNLEDSDLRFFQKRREEWLKKNSNVRFNVMVAGGSGLGKSTFIDAFLNKNYTLGPQIKVPTQSINERIGIKSHKEITFTITLIDTPGYSVDKDINAWYQTIQSYIKDKFAHYKEASEKLKKLKKDKSQLEDKRVHAILYFISGPRINSRDLEVMSKLQNYCNIIPVLAKGDSYTPQEIKEIKKGFMEQAFKKIKFFDFDEVLKDAPEKLNQLKNGKFGPCPPFLIISSAKRIEISPKCFVFGRQYPWGLCNIENPDHSDFVLLQSLLGGYICLEAIQTTHIYYKAFREKMREKKKIQKEKETNAKIGVGVAVACGVAALITFKKNLFG